MDRITAHTNAVSRAADALDEVRRELRTVKLDATNAQLMVLHMAARRASIQSRAIMEIAFDHL